MDHGSQWWQWVKCKKSMFIYLGNRDVVSYVIVHADLNKSTVTTEGVELRK